LIVLKGENLGFQKDLKQFLPIYLKHGTIDNEISFFRPVKLNVRISMHCILRLEKEIIC